MFLGYIRNISGIQIPSFIKIIVKYKRLSDWGFCAEENACFNVGADKKYVKLKFIAEHELYLASNGRVYTPVKINRGSANVYWMDCITGSLFDRTGFNKTIGYRLNISGLVYNQELCAEILMGTRLRTGNYREFVTEQGFYVS